MQAKDVRHLPIATHALNPNMVPNRTATAL